MKRIYFLFAFLCLSLIVMAQKKTVSGVIIGDSNMPIIGANVIEVGSAIGTISDMDGKFTIEVPSNGSLKISYIGYKTRTIPVAGKSFLNIILTEDNETLSEIVVTGYGGTQKRTTLTTAISKLDSKALENVAMSNAAQALQGAVSGLRVVNTSGKPGTAPNVVLRGGATITGDNNQALVVIDGVVRTMADINPEDIESIQVLKDAASTAIYGARANSGVILVTTKKGKEGSASISYSFKGGFNFARKGYDYMNAGDFLFYNRRGAKASFDGGLTDMTLTNTNSQNGYGVNSNQNMFSIKYLTDDNKHLLNQGWQQMTDPYDGTSQIIFKDYGGQMQNVAFKDPSFTQDHYISITGGNEKGKFMASLGYYKENGQLVGTYYDRFTGNVNGSYNIRKNLTVNAGANFSYARLPGLWSTESNLFYRMLGLWPTYNPWDEQGNPTSGNGTADGNPLYYLDKLQRFEDIRRSTFNIGVTWEILPGLKLSEASSIYYIDNVQENFDKAYLVQSQSSPNKTRAAMAKYDKQVQQQHSATLNYVKTFVSKHNLDAMVGGEFFQWNHFNMQEEGKNAPSDDIPTLNASAERTKVYSFREGYRMWSGFARVNYDYNLKYLFSVVARYDGISKLSDNRWGFFPGVSAGWNIQEEEFYKASKLSEVVSTLKPRISYGLNGNVAGLGNYDVYGAYGSQTAYNGNIGFLNTGIVNSNLRWEKSKSLEVGLDIGLMNNRLNLILDYYNRTTSDLLTDIQLPGYTGFEKFRTNLGSLRNTGFEVELKYNILSNLKGFSWDFSANASFVKNKIVKLPYNGNENNRQGGIQVWDPKAGKLVWGGGLQEGKSLGDIYAYKQERIFRDWDDVKANAGNRYDAIAELYGPELWAKMSEAERKGKKPIEPGDVKWADLDGNNEINSFDQVKVGNMFPNWIGGFSTTLSYKNISLYGRFDYALGHTLYNDLKARTMGQYQGSFNLLTEVKKMWSPENPDADYPRFYYKDQDTKRNITRSNQASPNLNSNNSRFYEKGDYLALRELTVSYKLPKQWVSKVAMTDASIYVTGQNLFYITGYSGTSPEPSLSTGVDGGRYPMPRTLLFGLQVSF